MNSNKSKMRCKRGFTLIELLVVVLIIGILSAVVVSQYQKAVLRTKVSTVLPMLQSIANAQERYYLQNGKYTGSFEALDISLPEDCKSLPGNKQVGLILACGTDWAFHLSQYGSVAAYLCPSNNKTQWSDCSDKLIVQLSWNYPHGTYASRGVSCIRTTETGKEICKWLSKRLPKVYVYG